ncbi:MAG: transposase, partial [Acidobacteria bacterium]
PGRYGHVAVPESNRRWATDLTTVWTREDGVVAVTPVIDCGDRVVLCCAITKGQAADAVLAPVRAALEDEFGSAEFVPLGLELRSDRGLQHVGADCRYLCDEWGLEHTFAPGGWLVRGAGAHQSWTACGIALLEPVGHPWLAQGPRS